MWRRVYSLLITLATPWALWRLGRASLRQTGQRETSHERLGYIEPQSSWTYWIHAASLGEVQIAFNLIRSLRQKDPDLPIVLTTFTATGKAQAREVLTPTIPVYLLPLDHPVSVARFLNRLNARIGVVIETEIWPNLAHACFARAIPLALVNAHLSEQTVRRYERFAGLFAPVFQNLSLVLVQNESQREHFIRLGAHPERVRICGNLKYEMSVSAAVEERGQALRTGLFPGCPVWVAGSTHEGEDAWILEAQLTVRAEIPDAILVLAPRHPDRAPDILDAARIRNLEVARQSHGERPVPGGVLLLDTIGDLNAFYAAGDAAFIGGSLVPLGGHNPLEPVLHRCPAVMGPFFDNVRDIAMQLTEAGALDIVRNAPELARAITQLLANPMERSERVQRGLDAVLASREAMACTLQALEGLNRF
ncbi:MAG: 3-deoxy-D-manno-octulosonic acid transferase [Gammaproteobacteria bacterium]